ncbi:MAG: peptide-methionine (R)-S-oxide reductase, partial [Candidatus Nitrosopolaris sp.]
FNTKGLYNNIQYGSRTFKIYGGYTLKYHKLTSREERVIVHKPYFSGEYDNIYVDGTNICRSCNNLLSAKNKFDAGCGWSSFVE